MEKEWWGTNAKVGGDGENGDEKDEDDNGGGGRQQQRQTTTAADNSSSLIHRKKNKVKKESSLLCLYLCRSHWRERHLVVFVVLVARESFLMRASEFVYGALGSNPRMTAYCCKNVSIKYNKAFNQLCKAVVSLAG